MGIHDTLLHEPKILRVVASKCQRKIIQEINAQHAIKKPQKSDEKVIEKNMLLVRVNRPRQTTPFF